MSYARWGCDGSDVYVFSVAEDMFICCGCSLRGDHEKQPGYDDVVRKTEELMIEHLLAHRAAGHTVPEYALERLRKEIAER